MLASAKSDGSTEAVVSPERSETAESSKHKAVESVKCSDSAQSSKRKEPPDSAKSSKSSQAAKKPAHPKKNTNAYLLFFSAEMLKLKGENPAMSGMASVVFRPENVNSQRTCSFLSCVREKLIMIMYPPLSLLHFQDRKKKVIGLWKTAPQNPNRDRNEA